MMRALTPAVLLLSLSGTPVATDYGKFDAVRIETETVYTMETTDFSMTRDGEPVDAPFGRGGGGSEEVRTVVQIDEVAERRDGAPVLVRRTFELVEGTSERERGEEVFESELECPLSEVTLELSVDDDGDVVAEVVEGDEPDDDALLEGHALTLALDAFLPEDEVDEGDSWDLEPEGVLRALSLDLDAALFSEPEREDDGGGEGRRGRGGRGRGRMGGGSTSTVFRQAEWEGQATLTALEEDVDGETCVVIEVELEASGDLPEPEFRGRRDDDLLARVPGSSSLLESTYEIELEGRIAFSRELGRPVMGEIEGTIGTERNMERSRGESSMTMSIVREGTFTWKVALSDHDE
ncbi:MAG: hypothetical protein QF903_13940 [Planctomycetota bacterium]|jgi:hypothetical protein|nr:hypothetical protein [Planctomycetota bacterium]MDP6763224.1 hypothetical protein [Planctomycetota bacterium]MDP6990567.1 hypothetical protein [Planctomycetota bacterium]